MEVSMGKKHFVGFSPEEPKDVQVETKEEAPVIKEPVVEEVEGIIDGVEMSLNIRSKPEVKPNNQIAILGKGTKIVVLDAKKPILGDGEEWYKVRLRKDADPKDPDNNGYAMKKYIKVL